MTFKTLPIAASLLIIGAMNAGAASLTVPPVVDFDPFTSGLSMTDDFTGLISDPEGASTFTIFADVVDATAASGGLAVTAADGSSFLGGALRSFDLTLDEAGEDAFALRFALDSGSNADDFGSLGALVAALVPGDFDTGGTSDFFTDGVLFVSADISLAPAAPLAPIPLPAPPPPRLIFARR